MAFVSMKKWLHAQGRYKMAICKCGCGEEIQSDKATFINGHSIKMLIGTRESNSRWKGGRFKRSRHGADGGYIFVDSGESTNGRIKYIQEHIAIAESVLGKKLPYGACVHHLNGIRDDNTKSNLVICQDNEYHKLLHRRERALRLCGNANFRKCRRCHEYDDPRNLCISKDSITHLKCEREYKIKLRTRR